MTSPRTPTTSRSKTDSQFLDAARAYADRGWPVFPLMPGSKRPFPKTEGLKDATTDRSQILEWWQFFPRANIAVATGHGADILDIDTADAVPRLQEVLGTDYRHSGPVSTTGKGRHLWFASLEGARNRAAFIGNGVDYRGLGGYVVAPPSIHPSGARYEWHQDRDFTRELPDVPERLAGIVVRTYKERKPTGILDGFGNTTLVNRGGLIERRPDITEVIQNMGRPVVPHGALLATTCPFHDDHSPSMVLYPDQTFHCFSCEAHGDSLNLLDGQDMTGRKMV